MLGTEKSLYLLEKEFLDNKDKAFIKIHINTLETLLNSLSVQSSVLKDRVDFERSCFDVLVQKLRNIISEGSPDIIIKELEKLIGGQNVQKDAQ